jgi:hypothetical protein
LFLEQQKTLLKKFSRQVPNSQIYQFASDVHIIYSKDTIISTKNGNNVQINPLALRRPDMKIENTMFGYKQLKSIKDAEDAIALKKVDSQWFCFPFILKDNNFLRSVVYDKDSVQKLSFNWEDWAGPAALIVGALLLGPEHGEGLSDEAANQISDKKMDPDTKKGFIHFVNIQEINEFISDELNL